MFRSSCRNGLPYVTRTQELPARLSLVLMTLLVNAAYIYRTWLDRALSKASGAQSTRLIQIESFETLDNEVV
eukprot:3008356-Amphidinium_carterae.1